MGTSKMELDSDEQSPVRVVGSDLSIPKLSGFELISEHNTIAIGLTNGVSAYGTYQPRAFAVTEAGVTAHEIPPSLVERADISNSKQNIRITLAQATVRGGRP
jgi:hypothetical protein